MHDPESSNELCGILNVHKPPELTSRDVVNSVQRVLGKKIKIGHAGTLDPMATGVLLIVVGRATRLIPVIHEYSKRYVAGFMLGQTSDTDDSTGQVHRRPDVSPPSLVELQSALQANVGRVLQTPPAYSAVKVKGRRAYQTARQGKSVKIEPRPVDVYAIELLEYDFPTLSVKINCGSGTYIRSIARDVGQALNVGGLMHELQRINIGPFKVEDSIAPEQVTNDSLLSVETIFEPLKDPRHTPSDLILNPGEVCHFKYEPNDDEIQLLRNGHKLSIKGIDPAVEKLVALARNGKFAARLIRCGESTFRAAINWVPQWFA